MIKAVKYTPDQSEAVIEAAKTQKSAEDIAKLQDFLNSVNQNAYALVCYNEKGECVGYALGRVLAGAKERIEDIFVIPSERRNGTGSVILVAIFHHAVKRCTLRVIADCPASAAEAIAFFSARGFSREDSENSVTFTKSILHMYRTEKRD